MNIDNIIEIVKNSNYCRINPNIINIIIDNKNILILEQFKTLYEYYNYSKNNDLIIYHINIKILQYWIKDWIFYLVCCQIFPEKLISLDIYTNEYNEILSINDLDLELFLKNHIFGISSFVRFSIYKLKNLSFC